MRFVKLEKAGPNRSSIKGCLDNFYKTCRRTCLKSDSMIVSLCFICARRYPRFLNGKDEHSSLSEEDSGDVRGRVGRASWDKQTGGRESGETEVI